MAEAKILRIYLDDEDRKRAKKGEYNIMNRIRAAFESRGFRVDLVRNSAEERAKSATRRGYSLFHMEEPNHDRALTLRRAYFYPFWRIEPTAERWNWTIAKAEFAPDAVDPDAAAQFSAFWRAKILPDASMDAPRDGTVYVPLQGRLLERRRFQTEAPIDMLRQVLNHEPRRDVICGLHPNEVYLPQELDALKSLVDKSPRLQLSAAPMAQLLQRCDYVATENSSVALAGYFLHKPAVLFAQIDFHHIALSVADMGAADAMKKAPKWTPDFDRYLYWFLKETAISGGSDEAEAQILTAVRSHGWQV